MYNSFPKSNNISQFLHFARFSLSKQKSNLDKGMLIISTDIDVGSPDIGLLNKGKRDRDVNNYFSEFQIGKIEQTAIPIILRTFDDLEVPITLAVRGQLTEINSKVMDIFLKSSIKHDIGAHGYSHRTFTDLSPQEAENELMMISDGMKKYGLFMRSFIFPKNKVKHLNLLEKYNYTCYRSYGNVFSDCMYIEKEAKLYNIHPSVFIDQDSSLILLKGMLNIAIRNRLPLHIWFHFWNFGDNEKSISKFSKNFFVPFLSYARNKCVQGQLSFETMSSATTKIK